MQKQMEREKTQGNNKRVKKRVSLRKKVNKDNEIIKNTSRHTKKRDKKKKMNLRTFRKK